VLVNEELTFPPEYNKLWRSSSPTGGLFFLEISNKNMIDLKVINSVLGQLEEERGIPREKVMEAVSVALATAYKKEYGKRGQIIRADFDLNSGKTDFFQVKIVVDPNDVIMEDD
jgi:hypothetical protein